MLSNPGLELLLGLLHAEQLQPLPVAPAHQVQRSAAMVVDDWQAFVEAVVTLALLHGSQRLAGVHIALCEEEVVGLQVAQDQQHPLGLGRLLPDVLGRTLDARVCRLAQLGVVAHHLVQNLCQLLSLGRVGAELHSSDVVAGQGPIALRLDSLEEADGVDRILKGRKQVLVPDAPLVERLLVRAPHSCLLVAHHHDCNF